MSKNTYDPSEYEFPPIDQYLNSNSFNYKDINYKIYELDSNNNIISIGIFKFKTVNDHYKNISLLVNICEIKIIKTSLLFLFIMKDKIFNAFKRYVLYWAHKRYPNIRKRIYSLEYYFDNFYLILNDVKKYPVLQRC